MALRSPGREDLKALAAANHFELSETELPVFEAVTGAMFEVLNALERMPDPVQPLAYHERDPGARPLPEADPLNAILRRCSVKGAAAGPLAGKRVGLKDCIMVAGVPMTCGSLVLDGYIPDSDATVVRRILDAGGEIAAKLNMDNLATAGTGDTSAFGSVLNPHRREYLAGGSSGGSAAALFYDDIDITLGGDQGGSIRIPASWCGVVGLKPTHGLVPYTDIVGLDATIDHVGPMARTVRDVALMLEVIAGRDPLDPRQGEVRVEPYREHLERGLAGLRIGVVREGFGWRHSEAAVDETVRAAVGVLGKLGAQVREISLPAHRTAPTLLVGVIPEGQSALLHSHGLGHQFNGRYNAHFGAAFAERLQTRARDLPPRVKLNLMVGNYLRRYYPARFYAKAQNLRAGLRAQYDRALAELDLLVMPTTPIRAVPDDPALDLKSKILRSASMGNNTGQFDLTGHPSLSMPCGKVEGLPVGLMLTGRHFDEATLLRVAFAYEQAVGWEA